MNRRERSKQKKKKARQERLRLTKHAPVRPRVEPARTPTLAAAPTAVNSAVIPEAGVPNTPALSAQPVALDDFFHSEPAEQWLKALLANTDLNCIIAALDPADLLPAELMLNARTCCELLVAAEVVAAAIGRPSRHLPAPVLAWLRERDALISPGVVALAAAAVQRVGQFSELRGFWDIRGQSEAWLVGVENLRRRLRNE
jgi:hypothetical protein